MDIKELDEAKVACDYAIEKTEEALTELNSASGWGIFDILAGGFLSSFIKHGKIDKAEEKMKEVHYALALLKDELEDIELPVVQFKDTSTFVKVTDLFFDNIFSDLSTQSTISENKDSLKNLLSELQTLRQKLNTL